MKRRRKWCRQWGEWGNFDGTDDHDDVRPADSMDVNLNIEISASKATMLREHESESTAAGDWLQ